MNKKIGGIFIMKKKFFVLSLVVLCSAIVFVENLIADGTGNVINNVFDYDDRFRNVAAVSSRSEGTSNNVFITSFGLLPYRVSSILTGTDAFLFRSTILNSVDNWFFNDPNYVLFDSAFESNNTGNLPDCGRNAYDVNEDLEDMSVFFGEEEALARFYGGTGSWASPVLIENDIGDDYLIILNKSGVLMCIDDDFSSNDCVIWAKDLRDIERQEFPGEHYKYEFMSTPTVIDGNVYITGIFHVFKVDFSIPACPLTYTLLLDNNDHYVAPLAFDLCETPNTHLICVSYNGKVSILDQNIDILYNDSPLGINTIVVSRPLVDADGQVYISANNGRICYISQKSIEEDPANISPETITCNDHNFVSSLITNSSKNIYAGTEENNIVLLTELYDFTQDDPLLYNWDDDYFFQYIDPNFRTINNHSVLFENHEGDDLNTSCLLTIYNTNTFLSGENYYNNFNPQNNEVYVRLFGFNKYTQSPETAYDKCEDSATFGGLAAYKTNGGLNNCVWLDENGWAWSWKATMDSSDRVDFPDESTDIIIPSISNPKFMRDLTNETKYEQANVILYVYGQNPNDYEKVFLNSYWSNEFVNHGEYFTVEFTDLLNHPNYTLGIVPITGEPIVFENIDISNGQYHFYSEITITSNTTWDSNNSNCLYQNVIINPGVILWIYGAVINLIDLTLYNESTVQVYHNSELYIQGTLYSDQLNNETGCGTINNGNYNSLGYIYVEDIQVENNGNLEILASSFGDFQIYDFNISEFGYAKLINSDGWSTEPICYVSGEMYIYGVFENFDELQFQPGSSCTIDGENAEFNVYYAKIYLNNANINVLNGSDLNLNGIQNPITIGAELHLDNISSVTIDGTGSELFLDWGSTITGCTPTTYETTPPGQPVGGEEPIPGDRIIAQNGGIITTKRQQLYYPGATVITISSSSGALWDGIFIKNPSDQAFYWFVNCDIKEIRKLSIENIGESRNTAYLNLYLTDFQDAGQIVVRDGHELSIQGEEGDLCYFQNNLVIPICAYESHVNLNYVHIGGTDEEPELGNGGGIYLYDSATPLSIINNCNFMYNNYNGVQLNGVAFDEFTNNCIMENTGFGMMCYPSTEFIGFNPFNEITLTDNSYAEYVGWESTFRMENPNANITVVDGNYGSGSDQYLLMNLDWNGETPVDIRGTYPSIDADDLPHLFPHPDPALFPPAWIFGGDVSDERLMLYSASSDMGNGNYTTAEQTLQQIIVDYPLTREAGIAVYYLYHLENITDQDFPVLRNYLENISVVTDTPLEAAAEKIITKSYVKDKDYITAIDRFENTINNSQIPDEVIMAMIDEGYCYMELSDEGERGLPDNCTVKTATLDEYQAKVRELESQFSFYPKKQDSNTTPVTGNIVMLSNYPNPFNPTTTISFDIANESDVSITVYNIKGQKVKKLINDQLTAGEHSVIWNGKDNNNKNVASGIYFYKISAGKSSAIKKMLLLK